MPCTHLISIEEVNVEEMERKMKEGNCDKCGKSGSDLWVCLQKCCSFIGCGKFENNHIELHNQETNHHLFLHLRDFHMWCFSCRPEVQPSDSSSNPSPDDAATPLKNEVERLQSELEAEKQKTVLFEVRQRDWSRQQENLMEQLTYKEQQEISLQERLRQKEEQETELQEHLRQKQRQETSLQERLRQKEEQETDFQEQLREKERQETSLQRQLRGKELEVQELEVALSATQQALNEQRRQEPRDWVISQDEIHVTDKCLGTGGWGSVVEGTFRGCKVAVKQIHDLILSPYNRRLFEREMNMASRCRHPCLLQFIGATNDEGSPLFVTELMETSLRALLQQRPLPQTELLTISLDVAQALNYLHLNRPSPIIHRDVSSANVLLWRQGDQWRGKVSDYGTANFMRQTMTTSPGAAIYSAPEAHTSKQTTKVDVYSFGVLLCEMCIREMPDPQWRDEQIALVPSRVLRSLTSRCVHLEPGTRPTMEDIIGEFEQYEIRHKTVNH